MMIWESGNFATIASRFGIGRKAEARRRQEQEGGIEERAHTHRRRACRYKTKSIREIPCHSWYSAENVGKYRIRPL